MNANTLPDIAAQRTQIAATLDWVGMEAVAARVVLGDDVAPLLMKADVGVNLRQAEAKGIHMSRLYLALDRLDRQPLTGAFLEQLLQEFLDSHSALADQATLSLHGELPLRRPALVSPLAGWKAYPLVVHGRLGPQGFHVELGLQVAYSSTCPCSAALARQLIQQRFAEDFSSRELNHAAVLDWLGSPQGIVATPHSQRSQAHVQVRLPARFERLPMVELVERIEQALGTAVQTAVKRADEQAFALANGQNLMFCEDAARRLHASLRDWSLIEGFTLRVVHAESLHDHDAVARASSNWR
ncbi:GTP cyclohydrolase FolE2 [Halopseudomonas phragmitis]|uniref:GTP cyclohydrolase FolE2 n=2 Tax=Pseudomonadaceae TaxID=135621 RepID=A0A1V0B2M0_9GAMM|nr:MULTISPECIES: GTP cyclohydrolase FolE2 [Pseudomonadaceae]AQZ94121.1 GTP cyclohydrolase [Halopseudomonas phragmitis]RHW20769.1 GTP cyclohydrolase I FolE2 [Pseudomonas jilinensis]